MLVVGDREEGGRKDDAQVFDPSKWVGNGALN